MFRVTSADAARACLEITRRVASDGSTRLTRHGIGVLLEELRLGADDVEVWDALAGSGLFRVEGKALVATGNVRLQDLYEELAPRDDVAVDIRAVVELVSEPVQVVAAVSVTPGDLDSAIDRVQKWG